MPKGKLSPAQRVELRTQIRERVTSGEKRKAVARALAARFGITPGAISWHIRRELGSLPWDRRKRDRLPVLQDELDRLLERDFEIRKAHERNLVRIQDLTRRGSLAVKREAVSVKPLAARPSPVAPLVQTLGSRLRELRRSRRLTLDAVARRVRTHKGYLSWIERGKFPAPSVPVVSRLARFYAVDAKELLLLAYVEKAPREIKAELMGWVLASRGRSP